jgi:hypothetical protein
MAGMAISGRLSDICFVVSEVMVLNNCELVMPGLLTVTRKSFVSERRPSVRARTADFVAL